MKRDKRRVPYPPCGAWNSSHSDGSKNRRAVPHGELKSQETLNENVCRFFLLNMALINHYNNFCEKLVRYLLWRKIRLSLEVQGKQ